MMIPGSTRLSIRTLHKINGKDKAVGVGGVPREYFARRPDIGQSLNESLSYIYFAAGGHDLADGRDHAGGPLRLPLSAALGLARGRLSDHSGPDLLSGRQSRRDGLIGYRPARSAVRPNAGPQPDVLDELCRRLGHHPAVQPRPQPRRGRARGPGGDQRGGQSPTIRSAGATDLRQGQSRRRADPDPGIDLEDDAADPSRGSRRYPARAEDLAITGGRSGQHQRWAPAGGPYSGELSAARRLRPQH